MADFAKRWFITRGIVTDNAIFRLHYKVTARILVIFGIIILCLQYIGKPINCYTRNDALPADLLNSYCWLHPTHSSRDAWFKKVGVEVPYPGIDHFRNGEQKIYNYFYQWVGFVLLFQAIWFYIPHYIWKRMEFRRVNYMMSDLNTAKYVPENRQAKDNLLSEYFVSKFHGFVCYYACYTMCEILNVANVLVQLFVMCAYLGGVFGSYGLMVSKFLQWNESSGFSIMSIVFPRMAKCRIYVFGASGDTQAHDVICSLPINSISEKMYLFLWFWFIILALLSFLVVIYRLILFTSSSVRNTVLLVRARMPEDDSFKALLNKSNVGDWFMLDLMCTNLDSASFRDVIHDIILCVVGEKLV